MYRGVGNGLGLLCASEAAAYRARGVKELNQTYQEDRTEPWPAQEHSQFDGSVADTAERCCWRCRMQRARLIHIKQGTAAPALQGLTAFPGVTAVAEDVTSLPSQLRTSSCQVTDAAMKRPCQFKLVCVGGTRLGAAELRGQRVFGSADAAGGKTQ